MKLTILFLISFAVFYMANCDILDQNVYLYITNSDGVLKIMTRLNPPMLVRVEAIRSVAAFDALAPFHNTATGIYSQIPRFPVISRTTRNKNIAVAYAIYRTAVLYPDLLPEIEKAFQTLGLNPNDSSLDLKTPVGVGNYAAKQVLQAREKDGMNQLGNEGGRNYNRNPYEDYTGYVPKNTAFNFSYIGNWQPNIEPSPASLAAFSVQHFVLPQYGRVQPFALKNVSSYIAAEPFFSYAWNSIAYKIQADQILSESKNLNDYRKMAAEHYDDKVAGLFKGLIYLALKYNLNVDDLVILDASASIALHDGGIVVWKEKYKYDTVRPFSAIRYLYGNTAIQAWGGPGKGSVSNITGKDWRSYLRTGEHPDYPSGTTCFCAAQYEVTRLYFGTEDFGYSVTKQKGSSTIEPGITPADSITLGPYRRFQDYIDECGNSRVWGGVHFVTATKESKIICKSVGAVAYNFIKDHVSGKL